MVIAGSLLASLHFLHAQTAIFGNGNVNAVPVQSVPDSIVQLTADAQGLTLLSPAQVPRNGTFWVVLSGSNGGTILPYPCPPLDPSLPIYAIDAVADGQFLVDGTVGNQATMNTAQAVRLTGNSTLAALEAQATAVVNLMAQIQTVAVNQQMQTMLRATGMAVPSFSDSGYGGSGTNGFYSDSFNYHLPTNGLWLEITNFANGWSFLNLHNATNQIYAIWSTTNLLSAWNVETEIWPTDPNRMPFFVPTLARQNLFLRAQDWTGVSSNGLPYWWT